MEEEEERKKMARKWGGRGELIIGMDSKSRWWKTFRPRAFLRASKGVGIERKQPWKNGTDTKGHA